MVNKVRVVEAALELPNGIPSHDTFARVFGRLNQPQQFQQCFLWIKASTKITEGEVTQRWKSFASFLIKEQIRKQSIW